MDIRRHRLKRYYFITTYAIISIVTLAFGLGLVIERHEGFKRNLTNHKEIIINGKKETMKQIVSAFAQRINAKSLDTTKELHKRINRRLDIAYNTAMAIYDANPSPESAETIKSALSKMIYDKNYVFIFDMNGKIISSPLQKDMEGMNVTTAIKGKSSELMLKTLDILRYDNTLSFVSKWPKPSDASRKPYNKQIKLKKFAPLNWVIGYGEYEDDFVAETQRAVKEEMADISFDDGGYLFAATWDGVSMTQPVLNKNMYNAVDAEGKHLVQDMINLSKHGGGFYEYTMLNIGGQRKEYKLSYVEGIPEWKWYIGTGVYITDIESDYNRMMKKNKASANKELAAVGLLITVIFLMTGVAIYILASRLDKLIDSHEMEIRQKNDELEKLNLSLETKVQEKTAELLELNASLEKRVREEVEKNRETEHIMFQQGRLASMGEMLSNIAHQWRQPLNNIGLLVQDLQDSYELGEFDKDYLYKNVEQCMHIINHMSNTIDDFRDFFKPDKENLTFSADDQIRHSLKLIMASLENKNIKVRTDLNAEKLISGIPGEYAQALINIITNAKDALVAAKIKAPFILIRSGNKDGFVTVEVEDNGGGIDSAIAEKIFEPYFTTKEEGQGTGIGLYFSKTIIEKNMKGSLTFYNTDNGVIFKISIPEV